MRSGGAGGGFCLCIPSPGQRGSQGHGGHVLCLFTITVNFCNLLIQKLGFCNMITGNVGVRTRSTCVYLLGELMMFPCGFS